MKKIDLECVRKLKCYMMKIRTRVCSRSKSPLDLQTSNNSVVNEDRVKLVSVHIKVGPGVHYRIQQPSKKLLRNFKPFPEPSRLWT